jgi:hypothetical protein
MRNRQLSKGYVISITLILTMYIFTCGDTAGAETLNGKLQSATTQLNDQIGMDVTVYNINLGLVKDTRKIRLGKGVLNLRFMDVASGILNPQKLLDKYVGKKIRLYSKNPYTEREEIVEATLLSNNGGPIFKIGEEITFGYPGRIIFPGVPEDLISKPTLVWLLENRRFNDQRVEASYLTNGINWLADYVVTLNSGDDKAALSGWVTIDNKSGTTYRNAKLKLVAGDVNRVKNEYEYRDRMMYAAKAAAREEQFTEDEFFEYHIYTLQRPSTIKNNQTKQIRLVQADNIPVKKELVYYGAQYYYRNRHGEKISNQKIGVFIEVSNKEKNNLGMPLPKGTVRVYKNDKEGALQFVGEDSIDHTPKDEKIKVKLGDAFDVVGSRKQTSWKKIAHDTYDAGFEISLRNHKKQDVSVRVIEPIPGDWKMLSSSHDYEKTEAFTAEFMVPVPQDKEVKVTYKVRIRY